MKAELVREHYVPAFAPVTIKITLESAEELRQVWHRFNLALPNLRKGYVHTERFECDFEESRDVSEAFSVLDDALVGRDIRP